MKEMSIKKATILNAISKYAIVAWNLLLTVILARLLSPEDYGVVAVATVFTGFFSVFADMGLGAGIIQNKNLVCEDISDIFGFTIYLAIVFGTLFWLFSFPLSRFYENQVYQSIGFLLALTLCFSTLNTVPNALMLKDKQFVKVAIRNIIVPIVTGAIAVFLALNGWKYYSLVFQSLLTSLFTFVWNFATAKKLYGLKLKLVPNFQGVRKILTFSFYQFAFSIINYFSRNLDNLLISKYMGEKSLGYYDKAYKLMLYPISNLTHVITPVLHPILSEHQKDKTLIYTKYLKVVKFLSIIGVFISLFCFLAAREIILIMFGEKWIAVVPCFRVLSLSVWGQMITASTGSIFQSAGQTKLLFKTGLINTLISVVAIIVGINSGTIVGVAICVVIAYQLHCVISFYILIRNGLEANFFNFCKELSVDVIIFVVLIVFCIIYPFSSIGKNVWIILLIKMCYVGVLFCLSLFITKRYKDLFFVLIRKNDSETRK